MLGTRRNCLGCLRFNPRQAEMLQLSVIMMFLQSLCHLGDQMSDEFSGKRNQMWGWGNMSQLRLVIVQHHMGSLEVL